MKKLLFSMTLVVSSMFIKAQDVIFTSNNWGVQSLDRWNVSPTSANFNQNISSSLYSASIAYTADEVLYYIPSGQGNNNGNGNGKFQIRSIKNGVDKVVFNGDLNGQSNKKEIEFKRLGARKDGWVYMLNTEPETGIAYLAKFKSHADGTVSDFQNVGTTMLNEFNNGDICFDGRDNLYLIGNSDGTRQTKLFTANKSIYENETFTLTERFVVVTEENTNFGDPITGNAFNENGDMYITAEDGPTTGIYFIDQTTVNTGDHTVKLKKLATVEYLADAASNYFPISTALPVQFGTIITQKNGGNINVKVEILQEKSSKELILQGSFDGKEWIDLQTLKSKGDSDVKRTYEFILPSTGIAIGSIMFGFLMLSFGRRKINMILIPILLLIAFVTSCGKGSTIDEEEFAKDLKFVRIKQVDLNGSEAYSKTVKL